MHRLGPLLRLFIGLKLNTAWPYAAGLVIYGRRKRQDDRMSRDTA